MEGQRIGFHVREPVEDNPFKGFKLSKTKEAQKRKKEAREKEIEEVVLRVLREQGVIKKKK